MQQHEGNDFNVTRTAILKLSQRMDLDNEFQKGVWENTQVILNIRGILEMDHSVMSHYKAFTWNTMNRCFLTLDDAFPHKGYHISSRNENYIIVIFRVFSAIEYSIARGVFGIDGDDDDDLVPYIWKYDYIESSINGVKTSGSGIIYKGTKSKLYGSLVSRS